MLHCIQESWWLPCTLQCCLALNSSKKIPPQPLGLQLYLLKVAWTEQRCFGELPCLDRAGRQWEVRIVEQEVIPPQIQSNLKAWQALTLTYSQCVYIPPSCWRAEVIFGIFCHWWMSVKARNSAELLGKPRGNCPRHRMMR